jgi:hypothetical protein
MINIRDFSVPAGAGSNYIAKNILWAVTPNIDTANNKNVFEYDRKIDLISSKHHGGFDNTYSVRLAFSSFMAGLSNDFISILDHYDILLRELSTDTNNPPDFSEDFGNRERVRQYFITHRLDYTMFYYLPHLYLNFLGFDHWEHYGWDKDKIAEIKQVRGKIIQVLEEVYLFYIDLHRKNCANSYVISHDLVEVTLFQTRKLDIPERKTGAFKFDISSTALIQVLDTYKNDKPTKLERVRKDYFYERDGSKINAWVDWHNKSVKYADVVVDYNKVFIENDAKEIEKLYEFFNVSDLYINSKQEIIKSFKEYGNKNLKVAIECMPELQDLL